MLLRSLEVQTGPIWRGFALAILVAAALVALAVFITPGAQPAQAQEDCTRPGNPKNVQATAGNAKLKLTWEEPDSWGGWNPGSDHIRFYTIRWRQDSRTQWNEIGDSSTRRPPAAAYDFTGTYSEDTGTSTQSHTVVNGTKYYLEIRASYYTGGCGYKNGVFEQTFGTPAVPQRTLSADATLSGLEIANAAQGSTAPAGFPPGTTFGGDLPLDFWPVRVLKEVNFITVKPTATAGDLATITVQRETSGTPQTVASGSVSSAIWIAPKTDLTVPHNIIVKVTAENGVDTRTYNLRVWQFDPLSFGSATISDEQFTLGADVSTSALPEVAITDNLNVSYTATGLPAGLYLESNRHILGTPTATTTTPATVTYKATSEELGSSASLTFDVTVNPPVTFEEDDLDTFFSRVITYTAGQPEPLTVTLPRATGGTGTLTYELVFNTAQTVAADVPGAGVNLDHRVLTIDGNSNENRIALKDVGYAVTYRAKDENGATATAVASISVIGPPTLSDIANQSYTAGTAASLTLPAASGPWWKTVTPLSYRLAPVRTVEFTDNGVVTRTEEVLDMEGMSFNTASRVLSGTPQFAGTTEMTYTATDGNGVSATKTFTITVVNGPDVPTSAPSNVRAAQLGAGGSNPSDNSVLAGWNAVTGATAYVVQVIADGGSYPDKPVDSAPDDVHLSPFTNGVTIGYIATGGYKMRVAARNADGVGPWSTEASFTVQVGGL